jgi:hypothetical protein
MKHVSRGLAVAILLAVVSPCLVAQEVIVGDPVCMNTANAPDQPPKVKGHWRPEYPSELRKTADFGYVILNQYINAKNECEWYNVCGTHPYFESAVTEAYSGVDSIFDGSLRMNAAQKAGVPIDSWSWQPIIFNPRSDNPHESDSPPRVLAVTPVLISPELWAKLKGIPPPVWAVVSLDAAGIPQKVVLESPDHETFRPAIESAIQHWRFAPARKDNHPVAADLRVPLLLYSSANSMPHPHLVKAVKPVYPHINPTMGRYGVEVKCELMRAEVLLHYFIDVDGSVPRLSSYE